MKTVQLRLVIEVEYDLKDETVYNLKQQLGLCARRLSNEGMLSGTLDAEVEFWDYTVEQIK